MVLERPMAVRRGPVAVVKRPAKRRVRERVFLVQFSVVARQRDGDVNLTFS